jgi:hypothetical protein
MTDVIVIDELPVPTVVVEADAQVEAVDVISEGPPGPPGTSDEIAVFNRSGTLSVSTGVGRFRLPFPWTILGISATVNTAPAGAAVIANPQKNGSTIFTTAGNRPTIPAGADATLLETVPDIVDMDAGDVLTVNIDQVGSSVPGADLTLFVRYKR